VFDLCGLIKTNLQAAGSSWSTTPDVLPTIFGVGVGIFLNGPSVESSFFLSISTSPLVGITGLLDDSDIIIGMLDIETEYLFNGLSTTKFAITSSLGRDFDPFRFIKEHDVLSLGLEIAEIPGTLQLKILVSKSAIDIIQLFLNL